MPDDNQRLLGNRYLVLKVLGSGVSGSVYLARDTTKEPDEIFCAVKELDPKTLEPEERQIVYARFRDEETYLRLINGFNRQIPRLYDEGFSQIYENGNEKQYVVLEYIEGETLRKKIIDEGALEESRVKEILVSLLPVISHIHSRGWIHQDINPSNIILRSPDDLPVLIDFGGVKEVDITIVSSARQTAGSVSIDDSLFTQVKIGKPGYMAPEQERYQPVPASDLYSLGITAIELLSGVRPASNDPNPSRWLSSHAARNISPDFATVIRQAVEEGLDDRYRDAAQMLTDLSALPENNERIIQRLDDSLSVLLRRQPITPAAEQHDCKPYKVDLRDTKTLTTKAYRSTNWDVDQKCDFQLSSQDEFCPNCGAYNLRRFNEDDLHLIYNSPEDYLKKFSKWKFQSQKDKPWLIRLGSCIERKEITVGVFIYLMVIGAIVGIVVGWFRSQGGCETAASVLGGAIIGFLIGTVTGLPLMGILFLVKRPAVKQQKMEYRRYVREEGQQLDKIRTRQDRLKQKLQNETESNQQSGVVLTRIEREVSGVIRDYSARENSYGERLSITRNKVKDYSGASGLLRHEEEFERALAKFEYMRRKYQAKLQEIKLLRLHSKLQTRSDREMISEPEMDELARVANEIYGELAGTDIQSSANGKNWFERILRIREILRESGILLTERENAQVMKNGDLATRRSQQFVNTLDLLNAYITYEDFYNEYLALRSEQEL